MRTAMWLEQPRPAALVVDAAPASAGSRNGGPASSVSRSRGSASAQTADGDPRADVTVVACSMREAREWLGSGPAKDADAVPAMARALRDRFVKPVCVVGVADTGGRTLDWLDTEHARGWLAPAGETIGDGEHFAVHLATAIGKGFVAADAAILARMATTRRAASAVEFVNDPAVLPLLSWNERPRFSETRSASEATSRRLDLYAIVDGADRVLRVVAAGFRTVQLRIKAPPAPDAEWHTMLRREVQQSIAACAAAGAELFVNDHWQLAGELGAHGVHLGQEDLVALDDADRSALQATRLALGVSSHSLWELCRARSLAPRYIACGPVWPTLTKAMPWVPQGLDNLAWWCRMAQAPVVAIGGVLGAGQVYDAARCGADGVCIVRGLGEFPERVLPALREALEAGRREHANQRSEPLWPHPSLQPLP